MAVPQAKKTEESGGENANFVIRNQNKSTSMEHPRQSVAVQETKSICFRRALYPRGGEYARGRKWLPQARNSAGRGREKSILPQGIQNKGYLRFPKPVSFRRDFWGEEQCCRHKCVKSLMEETVRRTHCDQISKEKLIAHLLRQIHSQIHNATADGGDLDLATIVHEIMRHPPVASAASPTTSPC
jgi:hypothetical protein